VPPDLAALSALLDVQAVAQLLACSPRHVYRLADSGRMPAPRRLGSLVRWSREELLAWIAGGCRPYRTAGRA
jgi:excisionase family DNA binding protein